MSRAVDRAVEDVWLLPDDLEPGRCYLVWDGVSDVIFPMLNDEPDFSVIDQVHQLFRIEYRPITVVFSPD